MQFKNFKHQTFGCKTAVVKLIKFYEPTESMYKQTELLTATFTGPLPTFWPFSRHDALSTDHPSTNGSQIALGKNKNSD